MSIKITTFALSRVPESCDNGDSIIARFSVQVNGMEVRDCFLLVTRKGGLTWWGIGVRIVDSTLRHKITTLARFSYLVAGGEHLPEWANKIPGLPAKALHVPEGNMKIEQLGPQAAVPPASAPAEDASAAGLQKYLAASERPNAAPAA